MSKKLIGIIAWRINLISWKSNLIKSFFILAVLRQIKHVTSLQDPSSRHYARAIHLPSKKYHSGGDEPSATLRPIWPARNLNLKPSAPKTDALPLDQSKSNKLCRESQATSSIIAVG